MALAQRHWQPNPFASRIARANSSYLAYADGALFNPVDRTRAASGAAELVHESLRTLVLNKRFSCVGGKAAFRLGNYRFGLYPAMGSLEATAGLARDLFTFQQERKRWDTVYATFLASFAAPVALDEVAFESALWDQLQRLHEMDRHFHGWDPSVSDDPSRADFSFSFGGQAYFVVGLHAASSRWTRRFAWPTLVFNAHEQFEELRRKGSFKRVQEVVRTRDQLLQGSINPSLGEYGEYPEARQYSGRAVEPDWRCPFHAGEPPQDG